jgi:hypothetical protein
VNIISRRRSSLHLPARRRVGVEIAEDVLNRRQQVLCPPLIRVEDVGVAERREVGAPLTVGANPRETVVLIRTRALRAEPAVGGPIRLVDIDAQEDVLLLARVRRAWRELVELVDVLEAG